MKMITLFLLTLSFILGCSRPTTTPKPDALLRLERPTVSFAFSPDSLPFTMQLASDACFVLRQNTKQAISFDVQYPLWHATIYGTYLYRATTDLTGVYEESIALVYRQAFSASQVEAYTYENDSAHVFATLYDLSLQSASPMQAIATDSLHRVLRLSLYFDAPISPDSVAPVFEWLQDDMLRMIETLRWQN